MHKLTQATPDMGRRRWILILCAWTTVGLLFTVQEIAVAKVHGGHVGWVLVGVIELERLGGVHAACDCSGEAQLPP
jgi:hypothetical protein